MTNEEKTETKAEESKVEKGDTHAKEYVEMKAMFEKMAGEFARMADAMASKQVEEEEKPKKPEEEEKQEEEEKPVKPKEEEKQVEEEKPEEEEKPVKPEEEKALTKKDIETTVKGILEKSLPTLIAKQFTGEVTKRGIAVPAGNQTEEIDLSYDAVAKMSFDDVHALAKRMGA